MDRRILGLGFWLLLRGSEAVATNTTTMTTMTTSTSYTSVTDTVTISSTTSYSVTLTSSSTLSSTTLSSVTSSTTATVTITSSSTTLTSTTSQTQTFMRPLDAALRAGAVPLCTPEILWAVQTDLFSEIQRYAGIGENLDCKDVNGELFIFLAVERCPEEVLAEVVRSLGVSPSLFTVNSSGFTPLLAVANRGLQVTRTLLGLGANRSVIDNQGRSLLHHAASWPLLGAVATDLPQSVVLQQLLLGDVAKDLPLHRALRSRRFSEALNILRLAVSRDLGVANAVANSANLLGQTLLHLNADLALLEELLFLEVNLWQLDTQGAMPWHTVSGLVGSVASGTLQRLASLAEVPVEQPDARGRTAMHYAAASGDVENVQWLISQGANLRAKDHKEVMPLQLALAEGHFHLVPIFNASGTGFALEAAVGFGNVTLVQQMILEQGYSPYALDEKGRSVIFEAVEKGQVQMAQFLASLNVSLIRLDADGVSVLGAAALAEQPKAVEFLLQTVPVMQRMGNDSTALHLAARAPRGAEIVDILLRAGALPDAVDYRNRSALHFSANAAVVEALLQGNATVEWRDALGVMPLHLAAAEGRVSTVEGLLTSRMTQVDAVDAGGRTALHWAVVGGQMETVQTLLRWCATQRAGDDGKLPAQLAPAGELRDMLVTGTADQCQCDCGKFQLSPVLVTGSWQQCSTVLRCRFGGPSNQALRCARNESVPLSAGGTGQWQPSSVDIGCRAVSSAPRSVQSWWLALAIGIATL